MSLEGVSSLSVFTFFNFLWYIPHKLTPVKNISLFDAKPIIDDLKYLTPLWLKWINLLRIIERLCLPVIIDYIQLFS